MNCYRYIEIDINNLSTTTINRYNLTPLIVATINNDVGQVKKILNNGSEINIDDTTRIDTTALMEACINDNIEIVKLLLNGGANINYKQQFTNRTVLMIACQHSSNEIIRILLKKGAVVDCKSSYMETALQYYINCNNNINSDILETLIIKSKKSVCVKYSGKDAHTMYLEKRHNVLNDFQLEMLKGKNILSNTKSARTYDC